MKIKFEGVFGAILLAIMFLVICLATAGCNVSVSQDPSTSGTQGTGTGSGTGSGTGTGTGTDPTVASSSIAGTIDASLIADSLCSTNDSANAVYIYRGDTVIAVDRSGSNTDPIAVAPVTLDGSGNYVYSVNIDPGIYTIAFTCQADLDQPTVAGDPVSFRGVTNVEAVADTQTDFNFVLNANTSGGGLNATIQALPANTWYEVPNSQMQAVKADFPPPGVTLPGSINGVLAYSGAAFDTKRNRMILWGGGHNNYYGNEIYVFSLTTLKWERVNDPSPPTTPDVCVAVLSDGNPNSRHTYYNLAYIPTIDKFWSSPAGSTSCNSGGIDFSTWTFDFGTTKWTDMNATGEAVIGWSPTESAYDPLTDKVYSVSRGGLYEYDVQSNNWTRLNKDDIAGDRGVVVDTKRHLLVVVGNGQVVVYDIGNQDYKKQLWTTTGGAFNVQGYRPGVNYDPVVDRVVVWDGGAVEALNMDTKEWTPLAVAPQVPYTAGTYGRFRYSPIENAYVAINSASDNVLIYKLTEGGGKK